MKTKLFAISLCLVMVHSFLGPFSTNKPSLTAKQNPHIKPSQVFGRSVSKPYETNAFYTNLVVGSGLSPFNLIPYIVKIEAATNALGVGFPQRVRA